MKWAAGAAERKSTMTTQNSEEEQKALVAAGLVTGLVVGALGAVALIIKAAVDQAAKGNSD